MGRPDKGVFDFSGNYEPLVAAPLDARTVVEYKSDLTSSATWSATSGGTYLFAGLMVAVVEDTSDNNGIYFLTDASTYTSESSWIKIADQTAIDELNEKIEQIVAGGSVQVGTRAELPNVGSASTVYFVEDENATYRWDDTALVYYCCGRDYEEISVINGGDSTGD